MGNLLRILGPLPTTSQSYIEVEPRNLHFHIYFVVLTCFLKRKLSCLLDGSIRGGSILMVGAGFGDGPREGGTRCEIGLGAFQCSAWDMDAASSLTCTALTSPRYRGWEQLLIPWSFPGGH